MSIRDLFSDTGFWEQFKSSTAPVSHSAGELDVGVVVYDAYAGGVSSSVLMHTTQSDVSKDLHSVPAYAYPAKKVPLGSGPNLLATADSVEFDSRFEGGNLRKAVRMSHSEYNLFLEYDVETRGHTQWYYFSVKNRDKTGSVRFNILNLMKGESLYSSGLKPAVYSCCQPDKGWHRDCSGVSYYKSTIAREADSASSSYFTLSFTYSFSLPHDTVYFAHCYPYTYSDLEQYLNLRCNDPALASILRKNVLCFTLARNECFLLTITQDVQSLSWDTEQTKLRQSAGARRMARQRELRAIEQLRKLEKVRNTKLVPQESVHKHKKVVVLTARVHPGESNSSFMMQGALDFLLSNSREAVFLRRHFIFKVVPMLNPDGVVYGNSRCSLLGVDLNRRWKKPNVYLHPTVFYTKKLVQILNEEHEIALFCDFHGHSVKNDAFVYGCTSDSFDSLRENCFIKMLPFYLARRNPHFSLAKSHFRMDKQKEATARMVLFNEFSVLNSFTLEASFFGAETVHFTPADLAKLGKDLLLLLKMFTSSALFSRKLRKMVMSLTPVSPGRETTKQTLQVSEEQPSNKIICKKEEEINELHLAQAIQMIEEDQANHIVFEEEDTDYEGSDACPSDNDDRKIEFLQKKMQPSRTKKRRRGSCKQQRVPVSVELRLQSASRIPKPVETQPPRLQRQRFLEFKPIGRLAERMLSTPNVATQSFLHCDLMFLNSTDSPQIHKREAHQGLIISSITGGVDPQPSRMRCKPFQEQLRRHSFHRSERQRQRKRPEFLVTNCSS